MLKECLHRANIYKLKKASLGEKRLTLLVADTCHNVDAKLRAAYPKLEMAGGYSVACGSATRIIVPLDPPYSAQRLKDRVGQGKVFIIPLQENLDITPDAISDEEKVRPWNELFLVVYAETVNYQYFGVYMITYSLLFFTEHRF